jgi:broad specificity phosphatase PhoE
MAEPARLVLIRHAAIDCTSNGQGLLCGSYDARLSDIGICQIAKLKQRLAAGPEAAALYSSPLRRATETAQAASEEPLARLRIVRSLAEINCGLMEGVVIEHIRQRYPDIWEKNESQRDENFGWPGGETYRRFRRRVLRAVCRIASLHPGKRVLLVTHAGVINQILGAIRGQSAARWENFRPGYASLTEVAWQGRMGTLLRFDDRTHLSVEPFKPSNTNPLAA